MADAFQTESRRKPTRLQQVGRFLEGFGAGSQGKGREYIADLRTERELRNKKLADASVLDAQTIERALSGGNQKEAIDVLVDRANLLERMGEDASDTYALRNLIVEGNTQGALGEVNTFLDAARRRGLIKPPAPIESKFVSTDAQGRLGTVVPVTGGGTRFEPSVGATAKPVEPTEYQTYTSGGVERYADGPYAGYSLGKVAEMQRTGQLGKFGDAMPSMTPRAAAPAPEVRPPMLMTTPPAAGAPDLYAGLSTQEAAILQAEQDQLGLERERAAAEEARRVAQEKRAVAAEERTAAVSQEQESLARNEALSVLGLLRGRFLNPAVYGDSIYNAATGPIEGNQEGASLTSYLPFGATPQEVTNFSDDFNNLNNLLTVGGLGRMTGVLSEGDIRLIRDAASGLKRTSSPQLLKARMGQIERIISDRLRIKFGLTDEEIEAELPLFSMGGGELDEVISRFNTPSSRSSTRRGTR